MSLTEKWLLQHIIKLVRWEVFIDSVKIRSDDLKDEFLFQDIVAFCVSLVYGKVTDMQIKWCHILNPILYQLRKERYLNKSNTQFSDKHWEAGLQITANQWTMSGQK